MTIKSDQPPSAAQPAAAIAIGVPVPQAPAMSIDKASAHYAALADLVPHDNVVGLRNAALQCLLEDLGVVYSRCVESAYKQLQVFYATARKAIEDTDDRQRILAVMYGVLSVCASLNVGTRVKRSSDELQMVAPGTAGQWEVYDAWSLEDTPNVANERAKLLQQLRSRYAVPSPSAGTSSGMYTTPAYAAPEYVPLSLAAPPAAYLSIQSQYTPLQYY